MKKKGFQGAGAVFRFSLRQQTVRIGWRLMTLLPTLLLLVGIPLTLVLVQMGRDDPPEATEIRTVFVADETGLPGDYDLLNHTGDPVFSAIEYVSAEDAETALAQAGARENSLALLAALDESGYSLTLLRPEGTALSGSDASAYGRFLEGAYPALSVARSGLTEAQLAELTSSVQVGVSTSSEYRDGSIGSGYAMVLEVMEIVLPYLCIMVLYFMVLIYGQGIAGSVILEKSSKLMDTMLVSLRPEAMILGKTLAGWLAGVLHHSVIAPFRPFCRKLLRSCPQAPCMSAPISLLIVAFIP